MDPACEQRRACIQTSGRVEEPRRLVRGAAKDCLVFEAFEIAVARQLDTVRTGPVSKIVIHDLVLALTKGQSDGV